MSASCLQKRADEQTRPAAMVAFLFVFLTAGCGGVTPSTQGEPPQADATLVVSGLTGDPHRSGAAPGEAPAVEPGVSPAGPSPARPAGERVAKTDPAAAKPQSPAAKPQSPAPTSSQQLPKQDTAAPAVAKAPTPAPLDLASLENRLKETKAIGLFTKIGLKNQVDDLLNQFRVYYQGGVKTTLAQLRQRYDLLLLKVLSLLQDSDPALATAIGGSREAIWGILADRQKFAAI